MPSTLVAADEPALAVIRIWREETWHDPLPAFLDDLGTPYDLTDTTLELFIRPNYDNDELIRLLSSDGDGIEFENAAGGLAVIHLSRTEVQDIPISPQSGWAQFLVMTFEDLDFGTTRKSIWRGPMLVFPGRFTP